MSSDLALRGIRRRAGRGGLHLVLVVASLAFLFPLLWMVSSSLKPAAEVMAFPPSLVPTSPRWSTYAEVFDRAPFARQYVNSVYIAVVVTLGTVAVSATAGYAFARMRFRGRNLLFVVLLSALLVPNEVTIIPLFRMMTRLGFVDSHVPLIVIPVFGAQSVLGTFLMRQFFLALPRDLEEAAAVDGLGRVGTFWHIALPLARPPIAALAILSFLNSWNLFLEPLVFLSSRDLFTLPLALTQYVDAYGTPIWNVQLAATTLTVVPVVAVFVVAQRSFVQSLTGTGIKG